MSGKKEARFSAWRASKTNADERDVASPGVTPPQVEAGREAARLTALSILATVRDVLGSLDRVRQVVKVFGMVNCAPGFTGTPAVIDGCSTLLVEVFGEAGRHARSAVGMAELPFDIAVEIEAILEVD